MKKNTLKSNKAPAIPLWPVGLIAVLLAALRCWLARGLTFNGIGYMAADDQLFIEQAAAILQGQWLGSYTALTLFKGPFYPLFIAFNSLTGLPLLTTQQCLYALACLILCLALSPLLKKPALILVLLAILLFNPMSFTNTVNTRVLREGIYPALTMLCAAGFIGWLVRLQKPFQRTWGWSLLAGLSLAGFWLTREERIWLIPTLVILLALAAWRTWGEKVGNPARLLAGILLPGALLVAGVLAVGVLNFTHYGLFAISEYDSPTFLRAYGSLARVLPDPWQPMIPVPTETRQRIYAASPAFARLQPYLEGDLGRLYTRYGENVKDDRREMGGGWFHIALREAVFEAGLVTDGRFPAGYYRQLTSEITAACDSGQLDCAPLRASFTAAWNPAYLSDLARNLGRSVAFLAGFKGYDGSLKDCLGTEEQLQPFLALTHERCWHVQPSVLVEGWAVLPGDALSVWVYDDNGQKLVSPTYHMPSPDLVSHFATLGVDAGEAGDARFQLEADCPAGCHLVVKDGNGQTIQQIDLGGLSGSPDAPDPNGLYYQIESIDWRSGDELKYPGLYRLNEIRARLLDRLSALYQAVMPVLSGLAVLVFLVQTILLFRKRMPALWWGIEVGCLVAILVRLVMVAWLETTAFNAIITTYLSPVYPFLLLLVTASLGWLFRQNHPA